VVSNGTYYGGAALRLGESSGSGNELRIQGTNSLVSLLSGVGLFVAQDSASRIVFDIPKDGFSNPANAAIVIRPTMPVSIGTDTKLVVNALEWAQKKGGELTLMSNSGTFDKKTFAQLIAKGDAEINALPETELRLGDGGKSIVLWSPSKAATKIWVR